MDKQPNIKSHAMDVNEYTEDELFHILDLNSPTDRELEAKIIFLIDKYRTMNTNESNMLAEFFGNVYNRFFDVDTESEEDGDIEDGDTEEDGDIEEGDDNKKEGFVSGDKDAGSGNGSGGGNGGGNGGGGNGGGSGSGSGNGGDAGGGNGDKLKSSGVIGSDLVATHIEDIRLDDQNPIFTQTVKRTVLVKSSERENYHLKNDKLSTDFTFLLSEPMRNVVSIKLNSISVPYTWHTISQSYGSNKFMIKGNADGINDGYHDITVDVSYGNYTNKELIAAVDARLKSLNNTYMDISFGGSKFEYNTINNRAALTLDMTKQYNETGYYLKFDHVYDWQNSIPGFLGFTNPDYYPYKLRGNDFDSIMNNGDNRIYPLSSSNNYFTVYKYIGPSAFDPSASVVDISFNILFSLLPDNRYTMNELINDIKTQIKIDTRLNASYSDMSLIVDPSYNYFELSLKTNRNSTNNLPNSKLAVIFPVETSTNTNAPNNIWTGTSSCFKFKSNIQEINNIISVEKTAQSTFVISTSPYIRLSCTKSHFDNVLNNYTINVGNNLEGYSTLNSYISEINNDLSYTNSKTITTQHPNGDFYMPLTKADLSSNYFTLAVDITKTIDQTNFSVDLSGLFRCLNCDGNIPYRYDLSSNNSIRFTFPYSSSYQLINTVAVFDTSLDYPNLLVNKDLSYTLVGTETITYNDVANKIQKFFNDYKDGDYYDILRGTTFTIDAVTADRIDATLTIKLNKYLTQNDYSIQFFDTSYIDQREFDISGGSFLSSLGFIANNYSLGNGNSNILKYNSARSAQYNLCGDLMFYLNSPSTINNALNSAVSTPIYTIAVPSKTYTDIKQMQDDINAQFRRYSDDLSGTNISIKVDENDNTNLLTELTVVINQKFILNADNTNSSWKTNLNIDDTMINQPYDLSNSSSLSANLSFNGPSYAGIIGNDTINPSSTIDIIPNNNTFSIIPYDDGITNSDPIVIIIPYDKVTGKTTYSLDNLMKEINAQFKNNPISTNSIVYTNADKNTVFRLAINKVYTAKDYYLSFYNNFDYTTNNTISNLTWDTTLGWLLGFRTTLNYLLNDTTIAVINTDTCINTFLYNNLLLCLDDYNLNRLNDGIVRTTRSNMDFSLPSNYKNAVRNPATGKIIYMSNNNDQTTANQLYSANELIGSGNRQNMLSTEPFIKDVFGIIPLKGLVSGQTYVEFGGTLQNQERIYFGPVNINKMSVKLLTDKGTAIDLNGQDWSFTLIIEQLYKKEVAKKKSK